MAKTVLPPVEVHRTVDDQGRDLTDVDPGWDVERPAALELANIRRVDVIQLRESLVVDVDVVAEPVRLAAPGDDRGRFTDLRRAPLGGQVHAVDATECRDGECCRRHSDGSVVD